jgi:hypothetical protein
MGPTVLRVLPARSVPQDRSGLMALPARLVLMGLPVRLVLMGRLVRLVLMGLMGLLVRLALMGRLVRLVLNGAAGPAGADGATGPAGADGAAGPAGADGADGATGPAGADGADGIGGYYTTSPGVSSGAGTGIITLTDSCSVGDAAIGAGIRYTGTKGGMLESYPSASNSWTIVYTRSGGGGDVTLTVICADLTP